MQLDEPEAEYVPASQVVHTLKLAEYCPAAQSSHLAALDEGWCFPAAHDVQLDAPEKEYVPAAQEVHELAALAE